MTILFHQKFDIRCLDILGYRSADSNFGGPPVCFFLCGSHCQKCLSSIKLLPQPKLLPHAFHINFDVNSLLKDFEVLAESMNLKCTIRVQTRIVYGNFSLFQLISHSLVCRANHLEKFTIIKQVVFRDIPSLEQ